MNIYTPFISYSFAFIALTACSSYQENPLHLQQDATQWRVLSQELCPQGSRLTKHQAQEIALLLNPTLRQARLSYAKSSAVSEFAGLWEDPGFSMDLVRVLEEHITNGGLAPSFTLPVTGLPALAGQIAACYQEADYWTMRAQERELLASLNELLTRHRICQDKLSRQRARLAECKSEHSQIQRLYDLGEAEFSEWQIAKQRLFDIKEQGRILERAHLDIHLELAALLGLDPAVFQHIEPVEKRALGIPASVPRVAAEALLDSPSLLSLQANYAASESELRREIRKQYPELGLSPAVEREDGNMKLGLGFSLSIPAWNRNREQIAASTSQRDIAADSLLSEYRRLLTQAQCLESQQQLALRHCQSESTRLQELRDILHQQERLYALGEIAFAALADTRHELYQTHLAYLDCLSDYQLIQVKIVALNPHQNL